MGSRGTPSGPSKGLDINRVMVDIGFQYCTLPNEIFHNF